LERGAWEAGALEREAKIKGAWERRAWEAGALERVSWLEREEVRKTHPMTGSHRMSKKNRNRKNQFTFPILFPFLVDSIFIG
jgi:hypothetical protein